MRYNKPHRWKSSDYDYLDDINIIAFTKKLDDFLKEHGFCISSADYHPWVCIHAKDGGIDIEVEGLGGDGL